MAGFGEAGGIARLAPLSAYSAGIFVEVVLTAGVDVRIWNHEATLVNHLFYHRSIHCGRRRRGDAIARRPHLARMGAGYEERLPGAIYAPALVLQ